MTQRDRKKLGHYYASFHKRSDPFNIVNVDATFEAGVLCFLISYIFCGFEKFLVMILDISYWGSIRHEYEIAILESLVVEIFLV